MRSQKFFVLGILLVIALIAIGIWLGMSLNQAGMSGDSPYSAVYMTTGDIYFGKLSWFPRMHLSDAWYLQRSVDQNNQPQFGVLPIKSVLWEPSGDLYLNPQTVVFSTRLQKGSRVEAFLMNPTNANGTTPPADIVPPSQPPAPTP